jgi:hypothetical protein
MTKTLAILFACLSLFSAPSAAHGSTASIQDAETRGAKSNEILTQMRQLDLLNQILPLLMNKDQIGKLLTAIEKARANVRNIEQLEDQDLAKQAQKVSEATKAGFDQQKLPERELLVELNKLVRAFSIRRQVAIGENVTTVKEAFDAVLNPGQRKAAANSLNPGLFDPSLKVEQMSEEQKIRFFIQEILLDPLAYDVLKRLQKSAPDA